LIRKLAEFLGDENVEIFGNQMRSKRNWDLYGGGAIISAKEAKEYFEWVVKVFVKAQKLFDGPNRRLNL